MPVMQALRERKRVRTRAMKRSDGKRYLKKDTDVLDLTKPGKNLELPVKT